MVDRFLSYLTYQKKYSPHTVAAYRRDLEQYLVYVGKEDSHLMEATRADVRTWLLLLLKQGQSSATVHRKMSTLRSFYTYLLKQSKIEVNPVDSISLPKKKKRLPVFLKELQTKDLFEKVVFSEGFVGERDRLILQMFYLTGMRVSELINVNESDIDFSRESVKVFGKRRKERIIPLLSSFIEDVKRYIILKNEMIGYNTSLFVTEDNKQMNRNQLYYVVKKYVSKVSSALKRSPHVLRHTFATQLLNEGAEINALKELLGHTSLAATQIYTHSTHEQLKKDYKQAHPRA